MSGEEEAKGNTAQRRVGWFTRLWTSVYLVLVTFVMIGVSIWLAQDFLRYIDRHFDVPFLKPLVGAQFSPAPELPKQEYGYVIEPVTAFASAIGGNDELFLLRRKQTYRGVACKKATGTVVNILSVDKASNASHWLFKGNDRAVLDILPIYFGASEDPRASLTALSTPGIAMIVAEQDTNKDGEINAGDRVSLYFYSLSGKAFEKLLTADQIALSWSAEGGCRVFYQDGPKSFVATLGAPDFKLRNAAPIANMPKLVPEHLPDYVPEDD